MIDGAFFRKTLMWFFLEILTCGPRNAGRRLKTFSDDLSRFEPKSCLKARGCSHRGRPCGQLTDGGRTRRSVCGGNATFDNWPESRWVTAVCAPSSHAPVLPPHGPRLETSAKSPQWCLPDTNVFTIQRYHRTTLSTGDLLDLNIAKTLWTVYKVFLIRHFKFNLYFYN